MEDKRVFIGFDYDEHFKSLLGDEVASWLRGRNISPLFPLDRNPGGDLLHRILLMITESDFTLFDCTTLNPNVSFELGFAVGKHLPLFLLYGKANPSRAELPALFKTQWGVWYDSVDSLEGQLQAVVSQSYPRGIYDYRTNQIQPDGVKIATHLDTIGVILGKTLDCSAELSSIHELWPLARIEEVKVEDHKSFGDFVELIGSFPIVITFLTPILEKGDQEFKASNAVNALIMFAAGLSLGMKKNLLMIQKGGTDYSDAVGLAYHCGTGSEFKAILRDWNFRLATTAIGGNATKIGRPNLGRLIIRNRLNDFISKHVFSNPILLRAPSGYGKSALVAQYLDSNKYQYVWYTFTSSTEGLPEFLMGILGALGNIQASIGSDLQPVLASFAAKEISESNLTSYLLSELLTIREKVVLILDDVHLIGSNSLLKHLQLLLMHRPANVGFLLLSREDLGPDFRASAEKYLIEIKKDELAFEKDEIRAYVETVLGVSLTNQELDLLAEKSEGWIASISLLKSIVAQKGSKAIPEIVARLSGSEVKIYDYFAEIVFESFPKDLKEPLLRTSILDVLKPPPVAFLLHNTPIESEQLLRELERKNSFLFSYQNQPDAYRYHTLFREFLSRKQELAVGNEAVRLMKIQLGEFFLSSGDIINAIEFSLGGHGYKAAVVGISKIGNYVANEGMGRMLMNWIAQIPSEYYENDHDLLIVKARAEEQTGEIEDAIKTLRAAEAILSHKEDGGKQRLLVRFLLFQTRMLQDDNLVELKSEVQQIIDEAARYGDQNIFFSASDASFDIDWQLLIRQSNAGSVQLAAFESSIQQIDRTLALLETSELKEKNLHRCQLLSDKAKVVSFVNGNKTANVITQVTLAEIAGNPLSVELRKQWLNEMLDGQRSETDCLNKALELSEKESPILKANILVERAEVMAGRYQLSSMLIAMPPSGLFDLILKDHNEALRIYSNFGHTYGVASVYNNVAKVYLLNDDKLSRDKYAQIALGIAKEYHFDGLISAEAILKMPTLSEMKQRAVSETERNLQNGVSDEDRENLIEAMLKSAGDLPKSEREERITTLRKEFDDLDYLASIHTHWCKHLQMYDTHNPLDKHPRTDSQMVEAYLVEDPSATTLYDSAQYEFGKHPIAKFLYCRVMHVHSDALEERANSLSDKFIAKRCHQCTKRET